MDSCTVPVCAMLNGQLVNPSCGQTDAFKYCAQINPNSLAGYDVRTMTIDECSQVFSGNPASLQQCLANAIVPGSTADPNAPTPEEQAQELTKKNNNVLLIAAIIIIAILISALIYSL
jgi:hypothetical protein